MIKITWDQGFKKIYRKKVKNNTKNPFNPRLKTHKLTGKLEGLWAFSVAFDCRVIFRFLDKNEVLLIDIGGHDEVY